MGEVCAMADGACGSDGEEEGRGQEENIAPSDQDIVDASRAAKRAKRKMQRPLPTTLSDAKIKEKKQRREATPPMMLHMMQGRFPSL